MATAIDPQQPLLATSPAAASQSTAFQVALRTTANLANFLPTGTVLTFELFSPFATNGGVCSASDQHLTSVLVALCGFSGFILSFSDSFMDATGVLRYGFATLDGLAVVDGPPLPPEKAEAYRLRPADFVHGITSLLIFAAVALLDRGVVSCFYPEPTPQIQRALTALPLALALLCSFLFLLFPNSRHGIGFPVSRI